MTNKKTSFEEEQKRLEYITQELEKTDLSLEKSLELYKEGMKLSQSLRKSLDNARHVVKLYTDEALLDFTAKKSLEDSEEDSEN